MNFPRVLRTIATFYILAGISRTSKKIVDRRSTSGHDNKKFRTRSVEKLRGMAFGFWKMATTVVKPDR